MELSLIPQTLGDQPSPAEIRICLARLLDSPGFLASGRRRELLAYIVEQTLAGRADRLKAFDLACAVLGRNERFDPQNDPIVRIEIGRLRRDLEQYYLAEGRSDPIRISIPKGRYVPAFEVCSGTTTPSEPSEIAAPEEVGEDPAPESGHRGRQLRSAAPGADTCSVGAWLWSSCCVRSR